MTRSNLPPHCYAKRGGVWFQRRGWQTVKFQAAPGTPEFAAEYARILRGQDTTPPAKRSFTALIDSYCRSPRWQKLAPRTKADYRAVLDWAKEKLGPLPVDKMQRKDVIRAQATNAKTVRFANYIVQVLRVLMEHAIDLGWRQDNPLRNLSANPPKGLPVICLAGSAVKSRIECATRCATFPFRACSVLSLVGKNGSEP